MGDTEERTKSLAFGAARDGGQLRLLIFWDGGAVVRPLDARGVVTVGRSREADVQVDHPSISRRHVAVHVGDRLMVEDLGSSNGTRVGGAQAPPKTTIPLEPGQIVELGVAVLVVQGAPPPVGASAESTSTSTPMARLHRLVQLVAASDLSVIIQGETGSGKEVIAEALHRHSRRAEMPFIKINCAALSATLLESELFGYERGAFTGAVKSKAGLIEAADRGTLLLDEVGEMPEAVQAALLRVVETRELTRVGSVVSKRVDVRFVAATHRTLEARVAAGAFRQDLYFRLNGITVEVPPLRERPDEIAPLAQNFADDAARRMGREPSRLTDEARSILKQHSWPGNVRELKAVIERASVLSEGAALGRQHLLLDTLAPATVVAAPPTDERQRIVAMLDRCCGNQTRAAKLLGMSRRTLVTRMDELGLPRPRKGV
jgi:two-component system, NtrC family, response regulator AtoC